MFRTALFSALFIGLTLSAYARPVSYPGGWTIITELDGDENAGLLHYTINKNVAVGYRMDYNRAAKDAFHGIQINVLAKRWNNPDSQANIYFSTAVGVVDSGTGAGLVGMQADWENRRVMTTYQNRASVSGKDERQKFMQDFSIGIAPYVAEFGSLHTWLMLHAIHEPKDNHNWQIAPMVRMFKGPVLIGVGYNVTNKNPVANAMIRF